MATNKRHRQPLQVMSDMNVTNLLDTAFILLITFMLVAHQLEKFSIEVSPPEVTDAPQMQQAADKLLYVLIQPAAAEGETERVYLKAHSGANENRVTVEEVYQIISKELSGRPDMNVVIETDSDASAGIFVEVMNAVRRAGIDGMGISVRPKSEN